MPIFVSELPLTQAYLKRRNINENSKIKEVKLYEKEGKSEKVRS